MPLFNLDKLLSIAIICYLLHYANISRAYPLILFFLLHLEIDGVLIIHISRRSLGSSQ